MKVAVTAQGKDGAAAVDPRFGRCQYFVIADLDKNTIEVLANDNVGAGGGAGVATAQTLVNRGVEVVLTGNVGPNALRVLQGAGIKVYSTTASTVQAALEQWQAGKATPVSQPNVGPHSGMGRGGNR
ncbi:MAG: NifB/NifX family molybdenum-iron cluster-binding protein [Moorella sp. (in: firmicutes)]